MCFHHWSVCVYIYIKREAQILAGVPDWNEYKTLFYLSDLVVREREGKQIKIVKKVSVKEILKGGK